MKLKKILASLTAVALAVTTMAFAPVSVSAANEPPEGTETVVGTFVATNDDATSNDDAASWTTSARWQGEWMQCVVSDANYNDNTYIKVTATNLGDYVTYPPPNWTATDVPWDGSAGVELVRLGEEVGGITVKTATDSTESTAYGYCKATEFTRDEYDQIGFNVYGIFSTMTIQLDVVSIDPIEYVETTLWSGSKNLSTTWKESVQISADEFDTIAGDKIVINFTINGEDSYHQLKIMDGSWAVLTSVDVNEYGATEVDTSPKGKVTVKLGEEYAGRTVTLYKGRKSTKVEVASMVLDENGNATFTVDGGKNYTAVVE